MSLHLASTVCSRDRHVTPHVTSHKPSRDESRDFRRDRHVTVTGVTSRASARARVPRPTPPLVVNKLFLANLRLWQTLVQSITGAHAPTRQAKGGR